MEQIGTTTVFVARIEEERQLVQANRRLNSFLVPGSWFERNPRPDQGSLGRIGCGNALTYAGLVVY